jgi:hypothetical protein
MHTQYPIPNTDHLLVEIIQSYLKTNENNICILEDATAKTDDPCIMHIAEDLGILTFGQEVYYILNNEVIEDRKKIKETILAANSLWHFVCIFTSLTDRRNIYNKYITEHELNVLSSRIERIAIGAYDGEGYIIWQKD